MHELAAALGLWQGLALQSPLLTLPPTDRPPLLCRRCCVDLRLSHSMAVEVKSIITDDGRKAFLQLVRYALRSWMSLPIPKS